MQGETGPETPPKGRRRRLIAFVIGLALVAAGVAIWWQFIRPRTIVEVLAFDRFQPGTQTVVEGTVTGIFWRNASDGPRVILGLDHEPICIRFGNVFGDPSGSYRIGQAFRTTLHFEAHTINGDPAVWAPELACPFPSLLEDIGHVMDAVSLHAGRLLLVYNGTSSAGISHYEIVTANGAAYRLDKLPVTLRKSTPIQGVNPRLPAGGPIDSAARWLDWSGLQYLGAVGAYQEFPIADEMTSLAAGVSRNGMLRFNDRNGNGVLDDGDRLEVGFRPTGASTAWDTYLLIVGGMFGPGETYVFATRFIANGPKVPLGAPLSQRQSVVDLRYAGDRYGASLTSQIAVLQRLGPAPAISDVRFSFGAGIASANGTLSSLPVTLGNGVTLAFSDTNRDGRLDTGDGFSVGNVPNHTRLTLALGLSSYQEVGLIYWIAGYGEPVGHLPSVTFARQGTGPWRAIANASFWTPEFGMTRLLRATVRENGVAVLADVPLVNGTMGTFANGSLAFTDVDGDRTLSTGDFFTLTDTSGAWPSLELSILYSSWRLLIL
jgi:hypothetical protein